MGLGGWIGIFNTLPVTLSCFCCGLSGEPCNTLCDTL